MLKSFLCSILFVASILNFGGEVVMEEKLTNFFTHIESVEVLNDGKSSVFDKNEEKYSKIIKEMEKLINNANEMPAFCVALDDEIKKELNNGCWLQLNFNKVYSHNELPFEALLIKVEQDYSGFNLIRKYKGKYDGRCFYISLIDNTMKDLYELLKI